jgi:bacterial/archaeal transporter family-2 protein
VTGTRFAIAFSFAAGLAAAAQASIAGLLGRRIGTVQAAAITGLVGTSLIIGLVLVLGRGGSVLEAIHQPKWLWLSGVFGAVIVLAVAYAPPRIGTFSTLALLIAGQLLAGALIDGFGVLGSPRIPVTAGRVTGLVLVASGAALTLRR